MANKKKTNKASLEEILEKDFALKKFRGDQKAIIERVLDKKHTLGIMPTGMGKSLCFQLPSKILPGLTVVISPLIALMKDQVDAALKLGIKATFINSSLTKDERNKRYRKLAKKGYELLYVTPERFRKAEFLEAISENEISLMAVDEAHCISEWGHDFRPDYTRVAEFHQMLGEPPIVALTATATTEVQADIKKQLRLSAEEMETFSSGLERENLYLSVADIHGFDQKLEVIASVREDADGPMILYCSLIDTTKKFSEALNRLGIKHSVYHGQLPNRLKKKVQEEFMASDDGFIIATPAFGLGVNKPNIRVVMHAEVPGSVEAYYQEVGRAGRDGEDADCILLYDEEDIMIQMDFIKWANPEPGFIEGVYNLVENHADQVNAEGYDYIRSQMHFYHSRDFRVETAVKLLQRWESLEGRIEEHNLKTVSRPVGEYMDKDLVQKRLKGSQKKLLEIVQYAKLGQCRKQRIYQYFGLKVKEPCGFCDNCCDDSDEFGSE